MLAKEVVVADRVPGGKTMERRKTDSTLSTMTASSRVSDDEQPPRRKKKAATPKPTDMLMQVIAKEMINSLMQQAVADVPDDLSKCSEDSGVDRVDLNLDFEAIADLVMSSVNKNSDPAVSKNIDQELRAMLRKGLSGNDSVTAAETASRSVSGFSKATNSSRSSTDGESCYSELSNVTGGNQAPMDIWHPDFWNADVEPEETNSVAKTSSTPADSANSDTIPSSELDQGTRTGLGSALHEFLANRNNEISSSDSEDDDDVSVLSDITGLTGSFEDFAEGRRKQKQEIDMLSRHSSCQSSGPHSILGSIVGSSASASASVGKALKDRKKNKAVSYSVNFGVVQVRQYERIMCDNPACTMGPAIGIGWNFHEQEEVELDEFERKRRRRARRASDLILNRPKREKMIRSLGYSERDIASTVRELNKLRYHRRQTVNNLSAQKMEEAVEIAKRKVKKILFLRRNETLKVPVPPPQGERIAI